MEYTIRILAFKTNKRVAKNIMPTPNAQTYIYIYIYMKKLKNKTIFSAI